MLVILLLQGMSKNHGNFAEFGQINDDGHLAQNDGQHTIYLNSSLLVIYNHIWLVEIVIFLDIMSDFYVIQTNK